MKNLRSPKNQYLSQKKKQSIKVKPQKKPKKSKNKIRQKNQKNLTKKFINKKIKGGVTTSSADEPEQAPLAPASAATEVAPAAVEVTAAPEVAEVAAAPASSAAPAAPAATEVTAVAPDTAAAPAPAAPLASEAVPLASEAELVPSLELKDTSLEQFITESLEISILEKSVSEKIPGYNIYDDIPYCWFIKARANYDSDPNPQKKNFESYVTDLKNKFFSANYSIFKSLPINYEEGDIEKIKKLLFMGHDEGLVKGNTDLGRLIIDKKDQYNQQKFDASIPIITAQIVNFLNDYTKEDCINSFKGIQAINQANIAFSKNHRKLNILVPSKYKISWLTFFQTLDKPINIEKKTQFIFYVNKGLNKKTHPVFKPNQYFSNSFFRIENLSMEPRYLILIYNEQGQLMDKQDRATLYNGSDPYEYRDPLAGTR